MPLRLHNDIFGGFGVDRLGLIKVSGAVETGEVIFAEAVNEADACETGEEGGYLFA